MMKINKKIVQEVLKRDFGVIKSEIKECIGSYSICYVANPGYLITYEVYYDESCAKSYLEIFIRGQLKARFEFLMEQGIPMLEAYKPEKSLKS